MIKKHHFIVIDDDATNNMICEFTIRRFNSKAKINLFTKPEEGLSHIEEEFGKGKEFQPTILFLDVNMPTMTGWEFLDVFRTFDEFVKEQFKIYILSSSIEDFSEQARTYPFIKDILSKPLKMEQLEGVTQASERLERS